MLVFLSMIVPTRFPEKIGAGYSLIMRLLSGLCDNYLVTLHDPF